MFNTFHLINTSDDPNLLNEGCGAEFIHQEQVFPSEYKSYHSSMKCVAFDGDADRQIYFCKNKEG